MKSQHRFTNLKWALAALAAIAIAIALFVIRGMDVDEVEDGAWAIGVRNVPAPEGASRQLRGSIRMAPQPDVSRRKSSAPETIEEWRKFIEVRSSIATMPLEMVAKESGASIERDTIAGVPVYRVTPAQIDPAYDNRLFIHLHGGGYVFGGGDRSVTEATLIATRVKIPVVSIDYRMPPGHPFPAALDDVVAVYKELLAGMPAKSIAIGGSSAGGGLALASVHRFRGLGLSLPGVVYAGTPWADLSKTGDTLYTNEGIDRGIVTYDGLVAASARLYAGENDIKNPLISPVYGDFSGFPPTYLVTGTRDLFLSDTVRTHRKLRAAGAVADLNVYEGMSHSEYLGMPKSPESKEVYADLDAFLRAHLE